MNKESENFQERQNFKDPLREKIEQYSDKFVKGTIFNPDFINAEMEESANRDTIAFDLDGTLRGWDEMGRISFLRPHLKDALDKLKADGLRMVIWSAASQDSIQQTLNRYPEFEEYFDKIISAPNYNLPEIKKKDSEDNTDNFTNAQNFLKTNYPDYYQTLSIGLYESPPIASKRGYRPAKDISILGYKLLVEDDPMALRDAEKFGFSCLLTTSYNFDNTNVKTFLEYPQGYDFKKVHREDFVMHLYERVKEALGHDNKLKPYDEVLEDTNKQG